VSWRILAHQRPVSCAGSLKLTFGATGYHPTVTGASRACLRYQARALSARCCHTALRQLLIGTLPGPLQTSTMKSSAVGSPQAVRSPRITDMMRRLAIALPLALVLAPGTGLLVPGASAQLDAGSNDAQDGAGWTGTTHPDDVISARRWLMDELEQLIRPIDAFAAGDPADAGRLREAAATVAAMLATVPHLFPPTTDRYDPTADVPDTLAMPAIWQDFDAFYRLATASTSAAETLAGADAGSLRQAAATLRASCDACHALYLRPWEPAGVTSEDLEFDFDAIFAPD
jgi:cytochrome c556